MNDLSQSWSTSLSASLIHTDPVFHNNSTLKLDVVSTGTKIQLWPQKCAKKFPLTSVPIHWPPCPLTLTRCCRCPLMLSLYSHCSASAAGLEGWYLYQRPKSTCCDRKLCPKFPHVTPYSLASPPTLTPPASSATNDGSWPPHKLIHFSPVLNT